MHKVMKNVSITATVLGLAIAAPGSNNSSPVVLANNALSSSYLSIDSYKITDTTVVAGFTESNTIIDRSSRLKRMAEESFGVMRDATEEELKGVDQYIKSISKPTGVNFFSLC